MRDPAFFARVELHSDGRLISWPAEVEFCADALWQDVHERVSQPAYEPTCDVAYGKFSPRREKGGDCNGIESAETDPICQTTAEGRRVYCRCAAQKR